MLTATLVSLVALGLAMTLAVHLSHRALLRSASPASSGPARAVSVLKPLKGLDENLEANLRTFFALDHPEFELLFGVADAGDPALDVARRMIAAHPRVRARIVIDERKVGVNPKVNNLANLARHAHHEILLVSDSNVAVEPGYITDLVARLDAPGVGLVTSPIRGCGGRGLGAALEGMHLNTFVMGGVASASFLLRLPIVVGKSMVFRRSDLEAIGGFPFLARHLAEDQVCGDSLRSAGRMIAISNRPVNNMLGRVGVADFGRRILRWALMRWRLCPLGYVAEILLDPVFVSLIGLALRPGAITLTAAVVALGLMSTHAAVAERRLGVRRALLAYPCLEFLRGVIVGILAPVPLFMTTVTWRGTAFRVGRRTRLDAVRATRPPIGRGVGRPRADAIAR